jgi:hypothetical protein
MTLLRSVVVQAIEPAFALLPPRLNTPEAVVMLLAAGLQESRLEFRFQKTNDPYTKGPARGLWQFERSGGVFGVMNHHVTQPLARALCIARNEPFDSVIIHARLEFDDILAAGFARLLLLADPRPLPARTASREEAWQCYLRCWRPGKPHRHTWDNFHAQALAEVG